MVVVDGNSSIHRNSGRGGIVIINSSAIADGAAVQWVTDESSDCSSGTIIVSSSKCRTVASDGSSSIHRSIHGRLPAWATFNG